MSAASRVRIHFHAALLLALVAIGGVACADNCLQVQDTLCNCYGKTTDELTACENNASTAEQSEPPTTSQLKACGTVLPKCQKAISNGNNCPALQTIEGRQACGLAQSDTQDPPDGGA